MPRATRRRTIAAPPSDVWALVSDPYSLPRWWPRTSRVENVDRKPAGARSQWTKVLETAEGRGVRADYRCIGSTEGKRYAWEQQLAGSPFERHLRNSEVEIRLRPEGGDTEVEIEARQTLRGLSRLGSPLMGRGQGAILDEALDGLERTLTGGEK
ncbi:MAG TPA: SRPBCC family protein [Solirubrobacterales bacterium]